MRFFSRSNVAAFAVLALLSMAPGAFGAMYQWSKTAGTNATADPTINWAEGMAPSAVNDSARAMMARTAEWRDDIAGAIVTGGTSTAYTLATNQVFSSLSAMGDRVVAFRPHTTNGDAPTLNVDGLGAKPIQAPFGTNIPSGMLVGATPYVAVYYQAGGAWLLHGAYGNAFNVPLGACLDFFGTVVPNSSFAFPYGQALSRTTYAALFAIFSTNFGPGDGSTTFNIPDLRGRVVAGLDNMGGVAASRIGNVVTDGGTINGVTFSGGGSSTHVLTTAEMPVHAHGITDPGHVHAVKASTQQANGGSTSVIGAPLSGAFASQGNTETATTGITVNNAGGSNAHSMLQPTFMGNKICRII